MLVACSARPLLPSFRLSSPVSEGSFAFAYVAAAFTPAVFLSPFLFSDVSSRAKPRDLSCFGFLSCAPLPPSSRASEATRDLLWHVETPSELKVAKNIARAFPDETRNYVWRRRLTALYHPSSPVLSIRRLDGSGVTTVSETVQAPTSVDVFTSIWGRSNPTLSCSSRASSKPTPLLHEEVRSKKSSSTEFPKGNVTASRVTNHPVMFPLASVVTSKKPLEFCLP